MRYIKEFVEATRNDIPDEFWRQQEPGKTAPLTILDKLMNGFAVSVNSKNVETFFDELSMFSDEVNIPKYSDDYKKEDI